MLGDQQSDDPFCRDMVRRTGMIFVSVGYRHAPEHRFPAAAEDGYAATRWIAEHHRRARRQAGPVLVAGWSAGGNIAAVTCQLARDRGGPQIAGPVAGDPVTDCSFDRPSYAENADRLFPDARADVLVLGPRPLARRPHRSARLAAARQARGPAAGLYRDLEFDPLRDEGIAYGDALAKAGVPVEQLKAHGQFHSSFTMVDVIITGVSGRVKMAEALRGVAGLPKQASEQRAPEINVAAS